MIEITDVELRRADLRTRLPFRYGVATLTETPHAFVTVHLRLDGTASTGFAADHLPPKWFTKNATRPVDEEIAELEAVLHTAARLARGLRGATVFDLWLELHHRVEAARAAPGWAPLLAHFGTSLVERAALDAFCRARRLPFAKALRSGALGLRLGEIHPELAGQSPEALLPAVPLKEVFLRHTVGLADPLDATAPHTRIDDGLPETLVENIATYGLSHFKVKFTSPADLPRLDRIFATLAANANTPVTLTLDGNESFADVAAFRAMWSEIVRLPSWQPLRNGLWCVEQPFHRDIALAGATTAELLAWMDRPPLIIDESDGELDSVRRALAGGYTGTSHKNCKGVFRGVANNCLLTFRERGDPRRHLLHTGEDLSNIGPFALPQDLAVQASLGIASVERNGHHYFRGLSFFPADLQARLLAGHPDLYRRHERGFATVRIEGGRLDLRSVLAAPFGTDVQPDLSFARPIDAP